MAQSSIRTFVRTCLIAAIPEACTIAGYHVPALATEPVDLALVIAADASRSIDEAEARMQRDGIGSALRHPNTVKAIRSGYRGRIAVTYVEWSSDGAHVVVAPWSVISDQSSADAYALGLEMAPILVGRRTSISEGLEFANSLFALRKASAGRRVIDISGDGPNNAGRFVNLVRDEVVAKGVTINGLAIINTRPYGAGYHVPDLDDYFRSCVIGGPAAFVVVAQGYDNFADAMLRKLLLEIVGNDPPRRRDPWILATPVSVHQGSSSPRRRQIYAGGCDIGERQWLRQMEEHERIR